MSATIIPFPKRTHRVSMILTDQDVENAFVLTEILKVDCPAQAISEVVSLTLQLLTTMEQENATLVIKEKRQQLTLHTPYRRR